MKDNKLIMMLIILFGTLISTLLLLISITLKDNINKPFKCIQSVENGVPLVYCSSSLLIPKQPAKRMVLKRKKELQSIWHQKKNRLILVK